MNNNINTIHKSSSKNKFTPYKDCSLSTQKINQINKPFKIKISSKINENVKETVINSQKSENVSQTKASSQGEENGNESQKKIIDEYRKMFEFSNFCTDKMKYFENNKREYETSINVLTQVINCQRVRDIFN